MRAVFLVSVLALVLPICASAQATPAILEGTVVDAITLKPIAGASVRADSYGNITQARTNSKGFFTLWNLPGGSNRIWVCHNGYMCMGGSVCVVPGMKVGVRLYAIRGGSAAAMFQSRAVERSVKQPEMLQTIEATTFAVCGRTS